MKVTIITTIVLRNQKAGAPLPSSWCGLGTGQQPHAPLLHVIPSPGGRPVPGRPGFHVAGRTEGHHVALHPEDAVDGASGCGESIKRRDCKGKTPV